MPVDLPLTDNVTARELAKIITEEQLARAITYLELVRKNSIHPGPEIIKLIGQEGFLVLSSWEINAVLYRLSFALCLQKNQTSSTDENGKPNFIRKQINQCFFKYRQEVLTSYNSGYTARDSNFTRRLWTNNHGNFNQKGSRSAGSWGY